ncbi:MAG: hypothetical protein FRX49_13491 [Trebouxia sp. A1-2]|nr:MAG: hypothetical protein FRX49_13491 [Trebouxia sp. A1-2]
MSTVVSISHAVKGFGVDGLSRTGRFCLYSSRAHLDEQYQFPNDGLDFCWDRSRVTDSSRSQLSASFYTDEALQKNGKFAWHSCTSGFVETSHLK